MWRVSVLGQLAMCRRSKKKTYISSDRILGTLVSGGADFLRDVFHGTHAPWNTPWYTPWNTPWYTYAIGWAHLAIEFHFELCIAISTKFTQLQGIANH